MSTSSAYDVVERYAGHTDTFKEAGECILEAIRHGDLPETHYGDVAESMIRLHDGAADLLDDEAKTALVQLAVAVRVLAAMQTKQQGKAAAAYLKRVIDL